MSKDSDTVVSASVLDEFPFRLRILENSQGTFPITDSVVWKEELLIVPGNLGGEGTEKNTQIKYKFLPEK
jgi:hypothetical protein